MKTLPIIDQEFEKMVGRSYKKLSLYRRLRKEYPNKTAKEIQTLANQKIKEVA